MSVQPLYPKRRVRNRPGFHGSRCDGESLLPSAIGHRTSTIERLEEQTPATVERCLNIWSISGHSIFPMSDVRCPDVR
jgi:hypothetical protein